MSRSPRSSARAPDGSRFTLAEPAFRRNLTRDPRLPDTLRAFWQRYEALSDGERSQAIAPVLNKAEAFLARSAIQLMVGQSQGIDLRDIFHKRAVVLVNLAKGSLGTETANLLGALFVTKLWQAALAQVQIPAERRNTAFAYLDEAQDIVRLPVPARSRCHPTSPARPGQPMRVEHEYERQGALALLAALDVRTGQGFAATPATTGIAPFMGLMTQVMNADPSKNAPRAFVIVDNDFASTGQLAATLLAFIDRYNQTARPFNWKYTAADLARFLDRASTRQEPANLPQAA